MHLILDQLKAGTELTRSYSLYHGLGLAVDGPSLLLLSLYTLHYFDFPLPTSYFALTKTQDENSACQMPNKSLYQWFGLASTLILLIKVKLSMVSFLFFASFSLLFQDHQPLSLPGLCCWLSGAVRSEHGALR